ncbi:MAG: hypothetical protein M3O30_15195 [Planctomycetota bacterium]|nr:hypothetical protein [Planctomycetota bacterium]
MPPTSKSAVSDADRFAPILDRTGVKDRTRIEKHLATCDAEPTSIHGRLWRHVATILSELVPLAMQSAGNNSWKFYIPDGKYRMQVFALEDPCDGTLRIYLPDVLNEAIKAKILSKTAAPNEFAVAGSRLPLNVESLTGDDAGDAQEHYKHLLGWNRKALRLTLSTTEADESHVGATDALLTLAAKQWAAAMTAAAAAGTLGSVR